MANKLRVALTQLVADVTGTPRYQPKIEWSSGCWTHNVFRAYEWLFGREYGIRRESAVEYKNGKTYHYFFTKEASIAHFEGVIRRFFREGFAFERVQVCVPVLSGQPQGMFGAFGGQYLFAIARDNYNGAFLGGSSNSHTLSLAVSGSDRLMLLTSYAGTNGTTLSSATYNSVSSTYINRAKYNANNSWVYLHYLTAPSTGTNNAVFTFNQNCYKGSLVVNYTGVDQTSPINASGITESAGTNNLTRTLTSTVADCWGFATQEGSNLIPDRISVNNLLSFEMSEQEDGVYTADTNGSVGAAGSKTMGWSQSIGSNMNGMVAVLIAPSAEATFLPQAVFFE